VTHSLLVSTAGAVLLVGELIAAAEAIRADHPEGNE